MQRIANASNAVNSVFRTFESCTIRFCWLGVMLYALEFVST